MCVFGSSIWKGQWYAFLCAVVVCVLRETNCPFLQKNSTIEHITRSFCCFFLAFLFHCSHRSFSLSLCRILLAKSYASPLRFFFFYFLFSVASVLVWWWWWLCIWYAFFNLFLTHMRSMSVCLCVCACVCPFVLMKLVHLYRKRKTNKH